MDIEPPPPQRVHLAEEGGGLKEGPAGVGKESIGEVVDSVGIEFLCRYMCCST